jgi:hypothetical protein
MFGLFESGFIISLLAISLLGTLFPYLVYKKDIAGKNWSKNISSFFNVFTKFLFFIFTINLSIFHFNMFFASTVKDKILLNDIELTQVIDLPERDVYYIILDGHLRQDVLMELYDYDNSDFISKLEELGFYVALKSTSNYSQTYLSLASSLNMDYLNIDPKTNSDLGHSVLNNMINNSVFINFLKSNGYHLKVNYSGWEALEKFDIKQSLITFSELEKIYLKTTLAKYFLPNNFDHVVHDRKTRSSMDFITSSDHHESNIMFAHIMSPHPPFIYDEKGNLQPQDHNEFQYYDGFWKELDGRSPELYRELYLKQLEYIDSETLEIIEVLLKKPGNKPIIILQSDHGPASYENINGDFTGTELVERHSILNAYYFPNGEYNSLYSDITPVNSFRIVLNEYFGQSLELLEDKNYFSTYKEPFVLNDVTDVVKSE